MSYVLQTNHLTKKIDGKELIRDVNIHVKKGEIYGFATYLNNCLIETYWMGYALLIPLHGICILLLLANSDKKLIWHIPWRHSPNIFD